MVRKTIRVACYQCIHRKEGFEVWCTLHKVPMPVYGSCKDFEYNRPHLVISDTRALK